MKEILICGATIKNDPCTILNVAHVFDIPDLDLAYYQAYKNSAFDKEEINEAYMILKDEVKRGMFFCWYHGFSEWDTAIPCDVICSDYDLHRLRAEFVKNAQEEDWGSAWRNLQKYWYCLKK